MNQLLKVHLKSQTVFCSLCNLRGKKSSCEFFKDLCFSLGAILRKLLNIGASTWLKASSKNLGEYSKTAAEMNFRWFPNPSKAPYVI